jgi:DNA-binding transcriptional LysR family regulator
MMPSTTLEQWVVLQTIVETGSYAKAAEVLNRSKTSVSYAVRGLQDRLGVKLLQLEGRKATLTEAGESMLAQVRPLLARFTELELRARGLKAGDRTSLSLVVDSVFPKHSLFSAFKSFQQQHPAVQLHVNEVLRTESEQLLAQREADLYLITQKPESPLIGDFLFPIDFVAVAHRDHPLLALAGPLSAAQLKLYPQVVIADRVLQRVTKFQPRSLWSFTTIEAAVEAVARGVGYGWLPWHRIESLLGNGVLRRLPLAAQQVRQTPLYLVYGNESLAFDPVVSDLAKRIRQVGP